MGSMHNNEKKMQVGKKISANFYYFKRYLSKLLKNKRTIGRTLDDALFERNQEHFGKK